MNRALICLPLGVQPGRVTNIHEVVTTVNAERRLETRNVLKRMQELPRAFASDVPKLLAPLLARMLTCFVTSNAIRKSEIQSQRSARKGMPLSFAVCRLPITTLESIRRRRTWNSEVVVGTHLGCLRRTSTAPVRHLLGFDECVLGQYSGPQDAHHLLKRKC